MAAQWRIRHKLMLGLGLFVAIMALLLGGTLRGLWSYYLTINGIRYKLIELRAAEQFKEAVDRLTALDTRALVVTLPDKMPDEINGARHKLDVYRLKLQDTLDHGQDPGNGELETDLVEVLKGDFVNFEDAVRKVSRPHMSVFGREVPEVQRDRDELREQIRKFRRDTRDLHDCIYKDLDLRISETRGHYQSALWILLPTSAVGLVLVFGLMCSFYAWVFHPIRDLEAGVFRVARGDFDHRIEVHSGDEMEDLGAAFNDMMQRLQDLYSDLARQVNERSRQLVRSERLASVGFLAAGVAHEINNPLASIAFCSEALEARLEGLLRRGQAAGLFRADGGDGDEQEVFAKYLKLIQDEAFRCKNITERLLAFSRTGERRRDETNLGELVQSVLDVTQHLQNHRGKHIDVEVDADRVPGGHLTAWVNAEEIKSVVLNLVVNALDSMDEGGRLTIRLSQRGGMAELRFSDTGCGMTQEVLENIFEPFFTRSRTGKGTGLGLTISHSIICQHGGEIEASSPGPNKGSTFTVRLPMQPQEQPTLSRTGGTFGDNLPVRPADARKPASGLAA